MPPIQTDTGIVEHIEFFNVYQKFTNSFSGIDSLGGYLVINSMCYIFMIAVATTNTTLTFPTPKNNINLAYKKNNDYIYFTNTISLVKGDYVNITIAYEV